MINYLLVLLFMFLSFVIGAYFGKIDSNIQQKNLMDMWEEQIDNVEQACNSEHFIYINGKDYLCMPAKMLEFEQNQPQSLPKNNGWTL